jgi:hypothetical protein
MTLTPGSTEAIMAAIASVETQVINPLTGNPLKAFATIPLVNAVGNMPDFINFPGLMIENRLIGSEQLYREFMETRMWDVVLYHSPMGAGTPEEKSGLLVPFLELVYAAFGLYPRLNATQGVKDAMIMGDSGVGAVKINDTDYWGIRFKLRVVRQARRPLAETD